MRRRLPALPAGCPENAGVELAVAPPEEFDEEESRLDPRRRGAVQALRRRRAAKLARCGLDYSPALIARNLAALLPG